MHAIRSHKGWTITAAVLVVFGLAALMGFAGCGGEESAVTTTAGATYETSAAAMTTVWAAAPGEAQSAATDSELRATGLTDGLLIGTSDQKVIADAVLDIEVENGGFQAAFTNAALLADRYGGYIVASNSYASGEDGAIDGGTIAIRVPAASFSAAVADAGKLGTLKNQQIMTQDVTEEYVDLQARIINSEAKVLVFRKLYDQAKTINEIVQVQDVLTSALDELEQLKGRLRYLDEHTSYSTLTMNIYETGIEVAVIPDEETPWGVKQAFKDAGRYLVKVFNGIIRGLGVIIPVLVVLAIIAYIVYLIWRRRSRGREQARYQPYPQGASGPPAQAAGAPSGTQAQAQQAPATSTETGPQPGPGGTAGPDDTAKKS